MELNITNSMKIEVTTKATRVLSTEIKRAQPQLLYRLDTYIPYINIILLTIEKLAFEISRWHNNKEYNARHNEAALLSSLCYFELYFSNPNEATRRDVGRWLSRISGCPVNCKNTLPFDVKS